MRGQDDTQIWDFPASEKLKDEASGDRDKNEGSTCASREPGGSITGEIRREKTGQLQELPSAVSRVRSRRWEQGMAAEGQGHGGRETKRPATET